MRKSTRKPKSVKVIDLFCGIGGMTHGFIKEGFEVVAGIDNDGSCRYGYEKNNGATFIQKRIEDVDAKEIEALYGDPSAVKVLIGCAPCQPFSKLNLKNPTEDEFSPLNKFSKLIRDVRPDVVSMENVKDLVRYPVFEKFLRSLRKNGYQYHYEIVDASDYGVPQKRKRLVLLASKLGEIQLIGKTHVEGHKMTVRDTIAGLPPLRDGEINERDPLHRSRKLSFINKRRIKATPKNGGNSRDWNSELQLKCHKKKSGKTYMGSVYGRMRWDEPAPTMTTQCIGLGNGRFGHPEQDRAISLREAALFQTFPRNYKFIDPARPISAAEIAKFVGNAVPVELGRVIAKSIRKHLTEVNAR